MTKTKIWAILLMVLCTAFTSSAQILFKFGANRLSLNFISLITNWQIILGMIFYGIGAILVIIAMKGGEVSVLYPIVTSGYVWVSLASFYLWNENLNLIKWAGIGVIIMGIFIITISQENKEVIELTEAI